MKHLQYATTDRTVSHLKDEAQGSAWKQHGGGAVEDLAAAAFLFLLVENITVTAIFCCHLPQGRFYGGLKGGHSFPVPKLAHPPTEVFYCVYIVDV